MLDHDEDVFLFARKGMHEHLNLPMLANVILPPLAQDPSRSDVEESHGAVARPFMLRR